MFFSQFLSSSQIHEKGQTESEFILLIVELNSVISLGIVEGSFEKTKQFVVGAGHPDIWAALKLYFVADGHSIVYSGETLAKYHLIFTNL